MAEFLLLMHRGVGAPSGWDAWFERLGALGVLRGGSQIGGGVCFCKDGEPPAITGHLEGYVKVVAEDLAAAASLLVGNPVFEAGGIVEIRELPEDA